MFSFHNWIPEEFIVKRRNNPFGVILATIVGIPMYADIFGTIPIAEALLSKVLCSALSFPLRCGRYYAFAPFNEYGFARRLKPKLALVFSLEYVRPGIIIVGYAFQRNTIFNCLILGGLLYGHYLTLERKRKKETPACACSRLCASEAESITKRLLS